MSTKVVMPRKALDRFKYCFQLASRFNRETEELCDYYIHRRLAAVVVAFLGMLDMPSVFTPNRITFVSLVWGVSAAYFVLQAAKTGDTDYFLLASICELLSITFDCCDGQLARMYQNGSLVGRVLDGIVDMLVALSHGFVWTYCLVVYYDLITWYNAVLFLGVGIVTFQQQCMLYDRIKNLFCLKTAPRDGKKKVVGLEEGEEIEAGIKEAWENKRYIDYGLLVWYKQQYLAVQNSVSKKSVEHALKEADSLEPEEYRLKYRGTMRLISWCGTGTHAFLFYSLLFAVYYTKNPNVLLSWFFFNNICLTAVWLSCMTIVGEM